MGKPRGKRNTKVKLAGVLSDVVTKINFKMATKDKWGGKERPEKDQRKPGLARSCHHLCQ